MQPSSPLHPGTKVKPLYLDIRTGKMGRIFSLLTLVLLSPPPSSDPRAFVFRSVLVLVLVCFIAA